MTELYPFISIYLFIFKKILKDFIIVFKMEIIRFYFKDIYIFFIEIFLQ